MAPTVAVCLLVAAPRFLVNAHFSRPAAGFARVAFAGHVAFAEVGFLTVNQGGSAKALASILSAGHGHPDLATAIHAVGPSDFLTPPLHCSKGTRWVELIGVATHEGP